jgi:hypothetical protein
VHRHRRRGDHRHGGRLDRRAPDAGRGGQGGGARRAGRPIHLPPARQRAKAARR